MFINLGFFFFILRLDLVTQTSLSMGGCPSERLSFASPPMYWDYRLVPLCPTLFFCHFVLLFVFFFFEDTKVLPFSNSSWSGT